MVSQRAGLKRRMPGTPARTRGHANADAPLSAMTAIPRIAAEAATLEPVYDLEARYGEGANKAIIGQSPVR